MLSASRSLCGALLALVALNGVPVVHAANPKANYYGEVNAARAAFRQAPTVRNGEELIGKAIHTGRFDVPEEVLAGGPVLRKMMALPPGGRLVRLQTVRTFKEFRATLYDEMFA